MAYENLLRTIWTGKQVPPTNYLWLQNVGGENVVFKYNNSTSTWDEYFIVGSDGSITVIDNLTSTSATSALSANMGRVLNDLISGLNTRLTTNESDVEGLIIDFNNEYHFQGWATQSEMEALTNVPERSYINNTTTKTVWVFNGTNWTDSLEPIPNENITPSDSTPLIDGTGNAGTSTTYARGDHRHPSDSTKANINDVYTKAEIDSNLKDNSDITFVNNGYTGTESDGSLFKPYKTIQAAIDASPSFNDILVVDGTYNESITISNKEGISIKALSPIGNRPNVEVSGTLTIDSTSSRIGINGLSFDGASTIDTTGSNIYIQYANFNNLLTVAGSGYASFRTSWFNGLTWNGSNVELNGCYDEDLSTWTLNGTGYTFACRNCLNLVVNHSGGSVIIVDSFFNKNSSGDSISSSASGANDALIITGGSLQQANGSYGTILKLGQCPYSLGTLGVGNDASLTLSGTRIDSGLGGSQVFVFQNTPGYTRTSAALKDHVIGISNKFVELEARISALEGS